MTQLFIVPYSLNNTSTLVTSFAVHNNPMSDPGEGLLSPVYSSGMTCPWVHVMREMEITLLHGLVTWSRLVPPLGTDREGTMIQITTPLSSPPESHCLSQNSGVILFTSLSAKKSQPIDRLTRHLRHLKRGSTVVFCLI